MIKIITLFLCIVALVWIFTASRRKNKSNNQDDITLSVQCSSCKTYISSNEAIMSNGKYYCCKECLD